MIICKSKVLVTQTGGKLQNDLELVVYRDTALNSLGEEVVEQKVKLYEIVDNKEIPRDIEEFKDERFYEYLNSLYEQHAKYEISVDMMFIHRIFKENNAIDFIDIDKDSEPVVITENSNGCTFRIETYELNPNLIMKRITRVESLADLSDETFEKELNHYVSHKILKNLRYLKGIRNISVKRDKNATIELNKINNHKIGHIFINEKVDKPFNYENYQTIKIVYFKGFCHKKKGAYVTKMKDITFYQDDTSGEDMLIIVDRGNYSVSEISDIFSFDIFTSFGNVVVGITNYQNVEFID